MQRFTINSYSAKKNLTENNVRHLPGRGKTLLGRSGNLLDRSGTVCYGFETDKIYLYNFVTLQIPSTVSWVLLVSDNRIFFYLFYLIDYLII